MPKRKWTVLLILLAADLALGLIAGVASVTGHYIGSGLAIRDGSKIVRPVVIIVLIALAIKVITELV